MLTTGEIIAADTVVQADSQGDYSYSVTISGTYTNVAVAFELSDDAGDTWYPARLINGTTGVVESSKSLTNSTSNIWTFWMMPGSSFRVRATGWSTGTAAVRITGAMEPAPGVNPAVSVSVAVSVSGTVSALPVFATTAAPSVSASGDVVWVAGGRVAESAQVFCQLAVSLTAAASSGSTMLFTVYTGASQIAAGTSAWAVPAGKTFRIVKIDAAFVSSGVGIQPSVYVVGATAAPSITLAGLATLPVFGFVNATSAVLGTSFYSAIIGQADVPAGVTLGIMYTGSPATSGTIALVRINGILY